MRRQTPKLYWVSGSDGWMIIRAYTQAQAVTYARDQYGRGNLYEWRRATDQEVAEYVRDLGSIGDAINPA